MRLALAREQAVLLAAALLACGTPPPISPAPPGALDAPLRLLSHADAPAELLVFDHPAGRRFVSALAAALEAVNGAGPAGAPPVLLTVLHWKHDRGEARLPELRETPVRRIGVDTRLDVWPRDFVEIAAAGRGEAARPVLLDPNRGGRKRPSGLARFLPELALLWRADWIRLPPAAEDAASGAGNVEALPDGRVLLGSTIGPAWLDLLRARSPGTPLTPVDASWLQVGHVDEIVSHVLVGPGRCDFSLVRASPGLAAQLARDDPSPPRWLRRRLGAAGTTGAFVRTQQGLEARIVASLARLTAAIAADGCPAPAVLALPVLFACEGGPASPHACLPVQPNPVNMTVLRRHVLVPDPGYAPFRDATRQALEASGQTVHFLDADFQHQRHGGVHCATNVRRVSLPPALVPGRGR